MRTDESVLRNDERIMFGLRTLYKKFGYSGYKVGKFEEYDLYAHNKSFLVNENVLTFTDTNGKLMALKPDVTLSIVKNAVPMGNSVQKLYYNENVYRTSAESRGFKEIMQTGLECIGHIDPFAECEVVMLALRSLAIISEDYLLAVSHMGLIEALFDSEGLEWAERDCISALVKSKNTSGIKRLSAAGVIGSAFCETLCALTDAYLRLDAALPVIEKLVKTEKAREALTGLCRISEAMALYGLSDKVYFDFSVINDCNYYDGITWKGFVNGMPDSVLSGGRYDRLLQKMGKKASAIGFAVYLDGLDRLDTQDNRFDVDMVLTYDDDASQSDIIQAVERFQREGKTVKCIKEVDASLRYRQLLKIGKGGMEILETND